MKKLSKVVIVIGLLMVVGCATYYPNPVKPVMTKACEVSVAEIQAAPLPKIAQIKEIVYFDFDKDVVRKDSVPILDKVAEAVKANPDTVLLLKGHTDKWGTDAYNMGLSKRRADSVKAELVSRGLKADMIKTEWFGESDLISKINRENRRVVILTVE